MNEHECCIQNLSILFFFFEHLVFSLFFLSACEDLIRADRDSWCCRMRIRWGGIRCQTTIIFFYLHSLLPYLSLCAYLGSGCSRISSALPWPLPLPSTLPTQVAFLPAASHQACTSSRERERGRVGWRGRAKTAEGKHPGRKSLQVGMRKTFDMSYWLNAHRSNYSYYCAKFVQTFKDTLTHTHSTVPTDDLTITKDTE